MIEEKEEKKDRLIKLLIEVFHEASESEGIYFTDDNSAIEILELIKEFDPSQDNVELLNSRIKHLTKKRGN